MRLLVSLCAICLGIILGSVLGSILAKKNIFTRVVGSIFMVLAFLNSNLPILKAAEPYVDKVDELPLLLLFGERFLEVLFLVYMIAFFIGLLEALIEYAKDSTSTSISSSLAGKSLVHFFFK